VYAQRVDALRFHLCLVGADYDAFVNVARPGAWNDPDQIIVGNTPFTLVQEQTQMALYVSLSVTLTQSILSSCAFSTRLPPHTLQLGPLRGSSAHVQRPPQHDHRLPGLSCHSSSSFLI
jgi:hypothetical protein